MFELGMTPGTDPRLPDGSLMDSLARVVIRYLDVEKFRKDFDSVAELCIILVDYYAALFFLELNTIKPTKFCGK
ncbi:hypothetical protein Tco_1233178, partial [Tanacetum coccineum]